MLNHSGSVPQVPTIFKISFLILLLVIQVQADAPINYNKELASDVELRGTFFTNDNADGFYVSLVGENSIQIDSDIHHIDKTIKIKKTALDSRFKKFNGVNIGVTYISNDGIVNNYISPVAVDGEFVYITVDFSTVIINGMTGTTTTTLTGLSGNQSISVPDGSSYDLNITNNQPSVWTVNGTDFTKRVLWTLNTTSENLTDFQVGRVTPYDSDMQVDMDDRLLTYYENDTLISFWDETVINSINATGYVKVPKTSIIEQQRYWMYYGNSSMNSVSSGNDTFIQYHGVETSDYLDALIQDIPLIYEGSHKMTSASTQIYLGASNNADMLTPTSALYRILFSHENTQYSNAANDNTRSYESSVLDLDVDVYYHTKIIAESSSSVKFYIDDSYVDMITTNIPNEQLGLSVDTNLGAFLQEWAFFRKYTSIVPTWLADGEEQTASGSLNITASVTGDSNEQSYNSSQSREFTLTPTGSINNVLINTTSTDYDVTVTTYWTENTTLQSETATAGYAKQYIYYTPSFNVTSADLNTTFTFNFSAQDYIGTASSTLNDVSKTTTRDGQDINASVGSLTEATPYWWNVTVPYNNIFTLSEQSDTTAFLGVSRQFSDSTYNDPEGLPIDSRLWNFGDGDDSPSSNPSHIYTTVGEFNANYSVTETATVSPQTILREFNVSVEVQPVQNLTSTPATDHIHFDWDDYSSADYWNVSELVTSIPYTSLNVVLDGVADACFDTCAYGFVGDSPNPYTDYGKELIYILRNETYLMLCASGEDNDGFTQDDNFLIGIDASNNNLSTDDRKFILGEGGTVTAKQMTAIGTWIPVATNAQGVVVGAGTPGAIQYEMFIPISELDTNFTNGSTIKFFMSRTHTASNPDIESYYPQTLINTTDATLWQSVNLTPNQEYEYIDNTSVSYFNATGLDIFTWYNHKFIAINGSDESTAVTSSDITLDAPSYTISGYIKDILGNPIANADVWGENGYPLEHNVSNASGFFIGSHFHNGTYTIYANATGCFQNNSGVVTVAGANLTNINITLIPVETVTVSKYQKIGEMFIAIPTILKSVFQKIADVIPIIVVLVFIMLIINVIGAAIYAIRVWR